MRGGGKHIQKHTPKTQQTHTHTHLSKVFEDIKIVRDHHHMYNIMGLEAARLLHRFNTATEPFGDSYSHLRRADPCNTTKLHFFCFCYSLSLSLSLPPSLSLSLSRSRHDANVLATGSRDRKVQLVNIQKAQAASRVSIRNMYPYACLDVWVLSHDSIDMSHMAHMG